MDCKAEFEVVDLITTSSLETRGVDAFALALIKAERQIRRLFTHLAYQSPSLGPQDIGEMRQVLARNRGVYFAGFEHGINALYSRRVCDLIGDKYEALRPRLDEAIEHRNKIFHGQLTDKCLTRDDLLEFVADIRSWCEALADGANRDFDYDGFARNSFRKSARPASARFRLQLMSVADYARLIEEHAQRKLISPQQKIVKSGAPPAGLMPTK